MDSFEFNKISAAVLIALLLAMLCSIVGENVVKPKFLTKDVLVIDVSSQETPDLTQSQPKPLTDIKPMLVKADVQKGAQVFKKCLACHTVGKGEPHKIGPNLWGIVMNVMAHEKDFAYSDALKQKKERWTYDNLNHFLYKPREFVPGTKMTFVGLSDDQERADVIAFLRQQADNPVPLP